MPHARLWLLVALLATLTWPLSVGAQSQPPDPARPAGRDTVVIGASAEPDTLHPLFFDADTAGDVLKTLFTREVQLDDNWSPFLRVSSTSQTSRTGRGRWMATE